MWHLRATRNVSIEGIERSATGVAHCVEHGLAARVGEIDRSDAYASYAETRSISPSAT